MILWSDDNISISMIFNNLTDHCGYDSFDFLIR